MRFSIFVFVSVLGLVGCREDFNNTCNVEDPRNLPWLAAIIDQNRLSREAAKIVQYTYRGESVYLVDLCIGCPDYGSAVYNCKGEVICQFGGIAGRNTCPDFSQAVEGEVIWSR